MVFFARLQPAANDGADAAAGERGAEGLGDYVALEEGHSETCVERVLRGEGRQCFHPLLVLPFVLVLLAGVWAGDVELVRAVATRGGATICPADSSWCAGLVWAAAAAGGYLGGLILSAMALELFLMSSFFVIFAALPLLAVFGIALLWN